MNKREYNRTPALPERDFAKLFPTHRVWQDSDSRGDSPERRAHTSHFVDVEPRDNAALMVTTSPEVHDLVMNQLCDVERDRIFFKAIPWSEGVAIWASCNIIISSKLIAIVDPSTMPNIKR